MVSTEHYEALPTTLSLFLPDEHFGFPEIENGMNSVFGTNRTGDKAASSARYWVDLNVYEERLQTTGNAGDVPIVCTDHPARNAYLMELCE